MRRPTLSTARIRLEPMTSEHLPLLVQLDADAEVLRYILGRARTAHEAQDYWAPICSDADADAVGLGWWVGRRSSDGDFLGWWDLSPARPASVAPTAVEAGWRLARRHWQQGYAIEGARAVLDYGFASVGLDEVWAETMAVNEPSRRVMVKLGMRHVRTITARGTSRCPVLNGARWSTASPERNGRKDSAHTASRALPPHR